MSGESEKRSVQVAESSTFTREELRLSALRLGARVEDAKTFISVYSRSYRQGPFRFVPTMAARRVIFDGGTRRAFVRQAEAAYA